MTGEAMIKAARIAQSFARDYPVEFIEEFVKIEDKDSEEIIIPFKLWKEQKELLFALDKNRLNVVLKARQLGISWLVLAYIFKELIKKPQSAIEFSRTEEEAKELIRRQELILENSGGLCSSVKDKERRTPIKYDKSALAIDIYLPGGQKSTIKAFASAGSAARSFTANILFFDEWAFQVKAREIWQSAYPTINRPTGGKVIGVSTIERGTLFEEIVSEPKDKGFALHFLPWNVDPRRTKEWYEATRKSMGDLIMAEYPATVEEALTIPGGCYFPEVKEETHIREAVYNRKEGYKYYISIDYGLDMLSVGWIWIDTEGRCRMFRELDKSDLVISDACREILRYTQLDGEPEAIIAPPDLWGRERVTGKCTADIFAEYGVYLVKASNKLEDGCMALKQMLYPGDGEPMLTFDECCTTVFNHLRKIQKDKNNPNVYSKTPHELTHSVDKTRYFAVYWKTAPKAVKPEKTRLEKYKENLIRRKRQWQ